MAGQSDKILILQLNQEFQSLYNSVRKQHPQHTTDTRTQRILSLDPGETTGVADYDGHGNITVYQKETKNIGQSYDWLYHVLTKVESYEASRQYDMLRYEDYRVYEWKAQDHSWSPVHTIRWIGAIQVAAHTTHTPNTCMMAQQAKGFWTDQKLDYFGLNPKGLRHGRDALRHLLYYILFPNKQ